jgi:hypothetical protein
MNDVFNSIDQLQALEQTNARLSVLKQTFTPVSCGCFASQQLLITVSVIQRHCPELAECEFGFIQVVTGSRRHLLACTAPRDAVLWVGYQMLSLYV